MKILDFIRLMASEKDGTPSSKRMLSIWATILYSLIILVSFFCGFAITDPLMHMLDMMFGCAVGNYTIGRITESFEHKNDKNNEN